jgi:hypothetical protein
VGGVQVQVQVQVQCADEMRDFVHCKITAICNKRAKKKPLHRSRRLRRSVNGTKQKCADEVAFLLRGFCFVLLLFVLFCFVLFCFGWLVRVGDAHARLMHVHMI